MDQNHLATPEGRKIGWPDGDDDVVNKYGTYEVQRTNGIENDFPQIAQGLARAEAQRLKEKEKRWRAKGLE